MSEVRDTATKKRKPIRKIVVILESPNGRYYGFRFIRCSDGATCEAQVRGGESNIRYGLFHDAKKGWDSNYFYTTKKTPEREIFALPLCPEDNMLKWVKRNLKLP
jgi:hypothetical protein